MNRVGNDLIHFGANEALVRALADAQVRFVVIGGLAVAWHCPERQADDMDLLVDSTPENSACISAALGGLNLNGFSSNAFTKSGLQIPLKQTYYAELLTPQEGAPSFSEVEHQAVNAKLFNISVRVASIRILIEMKKRAIASADQQYEKHVRDIELLERYAV